MYSKYSRFFDFNAVPPRVARLLEKAPDLLSLRFTLHEAWPGAWLGSRGYLRHVSLDHAPALFELPCSNERCIAGTYNLTAKVLAALARRRTRFEGEAECVGRYGRGCGRTMRFAATATYQPRLSPARGGPLLPDPTAKGPRASATVGAPSAIRGRPLIDPSSTRLAL